MTRQLNPVLVLVLMALVGMWVAGAVLTRFWPWIRANALAMTARRPRNAGPARRVRGWSLP
jgi:hypothetical protein